VIRLVLDAGVLASALLFRSEASALLDAWRGNRFLLAVSKPILDEYAGVLRYPKLRLTEQESDAILEQLVLPYCERIEAPAGMRFCPDPDDDKYVHCALVSQAAALVSGSRDVLTLGAGAGRVPILSVPEACTRYCR